MVADSQERISSLQAQLAERDARLARQAENLAALERGLRIDDSLRHHLARCRVREEPIRALAYHSQELWHC